MQDRKSIPERRQSLLVDKPFQYSLMRLLGAVWLLNTVVMGGLIYYLYAGPVFRVEHLAAEPNIQSVNSTPPQFGVLLTLGSVLGLALVIVVGLHMSHQIAGPLAQIKARLRDVSRGDLSSEVRFREGDYLVDLPDYFNEMVRSLRERGRNELEILTSIETMLDEPSPARARLRELLDQKEALLANASEGREDAPESTKHSDPLPAQ